MRTWMTVAVVCVMLGGRVAQADDGPPPEDLASAMAAWCDAKPPRPLDAACAPVAAWNSLTGHGYPRRYIELRAGVQACETLLPKHESEMKRFNLAQASKIEEQCQLATSRPTALPAASIGIDLVEGLGDLLVAEAKAEVTDYLLRRIGQTFCDYSVQLGGKGPKIAMSTWFHASCAVILPNGSVDVDAFSFGALKTAFKADLNTLPHDIAAAAQSWLTLKWKNAPYYVAALGVAVEVVYDISKHKTPGEILRQLGDQAEATLNGLTCDLTSKDTITKECVAVLAFEVARAAVTDKGQPLSITLEDAIDRFCEHFGVLGKTAAGTCVLKDTSYEQLHADLQAIYAALQQLLDVDKKMNALARDAFTGEVDRRAAPDWVRALRGLVDAIAVGIEDLVPADAASVKADVALLDDAFDAFDAIVAKDPAAIARAISAALQSTMVSSAIGKEATHAITVIVSLALAKDRSEVQSILADVTAPAGSYKAKYGARSVMITLDGFVGVFAGGEIRRNNRAPDGTASDAGLQAAPIKLMAPVGIDFTLWSRDTIHLGISATVLDPLALAVSTANDDLSADWKTLFEPGAYFRLGILGSPFTLSVGANYQWGRRSDELCGTARCFDGALQIGALLSADVPLWILR